MENRCGDAMIVDSGGCNIKALGRNKEYKEKIEENGDKQMTQELTREIRENLSAPLPKEAIEKAAKEVTRKGYDTTGYQYQFVVDRFNEVLGLDGWNFTYKIIREAAGKYQSGQEFYDITCEVSITLGSLTRSCVGGHRSATYADALKGAITNAFKKTAAFFGVGADAYRGTIDEDYRPVPVLGNPEIMPKTGQSVPNKSNLRPITAKQRGLLFGKAKEYGIDTATLKTIVFRIHGRDDTSDLNNDELTQILDEMKRESDAKAMVLHELPVNPLDAPGDGQE